jgi:hypothetical protein
METLALIGSIAFAICGIPAAYIAYKTGKEHSPKSFLLLWLLGEVCYLIYTAHIGQMILWLNYIPNLLCLLVMLRYNFFKREV